MFLEALALLEGYKIYNHECYVSFFKEILNESLLAEEFNEFRKIRNSINYYGKKIDINESEELLKKMDRFIEKIRLKLKNAK